ncbi:DUF7144 family membrane protein [Nocardioides ungokensis]|uniref:DUF7144 family membrane protein n=1 Tax=Nocardioides ungokensis TaxID=1643322 RepID=UPI001C60CAEC|nr:hypothetical protein [Nocardioides ungokensis]
MSHTTPDAAASQQSAAKGEQVPAGATSRRRDVPEPTGWVGWIIFAATMMLMLGTFHAIAGLVALFDDGYYLVSKNNLVVHVDYTAWGWTYLIGGIIMVAAGAALFAGQMWARIVGVLVALVSSVVNLAFFSAYPWWSAIMITIDVFVIWALTVHGAEMKAERE